MSDPRWLSAPEQESWRQLAGLCTLLPAALDAQLQRDAALSLFGYWVLAMLSEAPARSLRMSELAARSHSSPSRLSHGVTRLVAQGWVRREPAADDRRGQLAVLTDDGLSKLLDSAPRHVEAVRRLVFDALSAQQVAALGDICRAVLARVDLDDG